MIAVGLTLEVQLEALGIFGHWEVETFHTAPGPP